MFAICVDVCKLSQSIYLCFSLAPGWIFMKLYFDDKYKEHFCIYQWLVFWLSTTAVTALDFTRKVWIWEQVSGFHSHNTLACFVLFSKVHDH